MHKSRKMGKRNAGKMLTMRRALTVVFLCIAILLAYFNATIENLNSNLATPLNHFPLDTPPRESLAAITWPKHNDFPNKTALILVDVWRGEKFDDFVHYRINPLVAFFRNHGAVIIHAPSQRGMRGIHPDLIVHQEDITISGFRIIEKEQLAKAGVEKIYLAGTDGALCIIDKPIGLHSLRSASFEQTTVIHDAVHTKDPASRAITLQIIENNYSPVVNFAEIAELLNRPLPKDFLKDVTHVTGTWYNKEHMLSTLTQLPTKWAMIVDHVGITDSEIKLPNYLETSTAKALTQLIEHTLESELPLLVLSDKEISLIKLDDNGYYTSEVLNKLDIDRITESMEISHFLYAAGDYTGNLIFGEFGRMSFYRDTRYFSNTKLENTQHVILLDTLDYGDSKVKRYEILQFINRHSHSRKNIHANAVDLASSWDVPDPMIPSTD
ncbi:MAG: hypothetical protein EA353_09495 [Puniceicoccaceae bacterium]|nr:MAG: hypothetical protein EA353_09495 [Puniceicoccaceae bacterium]